MSEKNEAVVVATKTINGDIKPGTIFCPATVAELEELRALHAVTDASEADAALHAAQQAAAAPKAAEKKSAPAPAKTAEPDIG